MNLKLIVTILQIIASILLMVAILLQAKGTGLGSVFGGESMVFGTKRGVEKILFKATIILAAVFLGLSLASLFV